MQENNIVFIPCPKCWKRNSKYEHLTTDDKTRWIFSFKCECGHVYDQTLTYNDPSQADVGKLMKTLLNPKMLAKMAKETQKEMEGGG